MAVVVKMVLLKTENLAQVNHAIIYPVSFFLKSKFQVLYYYCLEAVKLWPHIGRRLAINLVCMRSAMLSE